MKTLRCAVFALALFAALSAVHAQQAAPTPFLRFPDIHGDRVVFTSEGDLWLGHIPTGSARRITSHPGEEYAARFSPDGKTLAFTAQYDGGSDVYVMRTDGGAPKRLTWDPFIARVVGWTPDGKSVLFRSRRANGERRYRLWKVPAEGGMPELLPIPQVDAAAMHADGRRVAYVPVTIVGQNWKRYEGGRADEIWLADIRARSFRKITRDPRVDAMPVWLGDDLYFVSERGGHMNLYRMNPALSRAEAVTHYSDYDVLYPASDGRRIVFQHGTGLALYDPAAKTARALSFALNSERIHTRPRLVPARDSLDSAHLGPTGKRVLVGARGQILSLPAEEGAVRHLVTGSKHRARKPAWSPDGARVAFLWDKSGEEQVWVTPADGSGTPKMLTRDRKGPLDDIRWSPDGKWLTTSDRESRILLVNAENGETRVVDQSDRGGSYNTQNLSARFSPDSKWIAFDREEPNTYRAVYLYEIATGKKTRVTDPEIQSYAPAWDTAGKYLYFVSDRVFNPQTGSPNKGIWFTDTARIYLLTLAADTPSPFLIGEDAEGEKRAAPVKDGPPADDKKDAPKDTPAPKPTGMKVDLNGIMQRIVALPVPAGAYRRLESVPNRLLFLTGGSGGGLLRAFNTKEPRKKEVVTITRVGDYQVSANGKKLLLQSGRDLFVVDATTGPIATLGAGRVDWDGATVTVDPPAEWRQIFHEGWRVVRDFFYDPNMHGVDWEAVRDKYARQLPNVGDRSELNLLLGNMMGELATGHAYVSGGDVPGGAARVPMGYLGADLEPVPGADAVRIVRVLAGDGIDVDSRSPLLEPGVEAAAGDYILAVNGRPVRADEEFQALMTGTAGRVTALLVNGKPSREGAREVRVRPLSNEDALRAAEWVRARAARVEEASGGRIGYIYLPDMGDGGLREFAKQYYPKVGMDALIFDVRNNGGGWVAPYLLQHVAAKNLTWRKPRYGESWTRTAWAFDGHAATLVNEYTSSNGEDWADLFQRMGLGPVIGVRTWGGLVGSGGGWFFVDGGKINPPNYGAWAPKEGWIVEGPGAKPDITVEQDPAAVLAGQDPQLERAIVVLRERLTQKPVPRPSPPPYPVKTPPAQP